MQVKLFTNTDMEKLEQDVNAFLKQYPDSRVHNINGWSNPDVDNQAKTIMNTIMVVTT